ncbi:hypothetical protein KCP74_10920 [Salmonella enterica subsp. enterica]|nr:hypothetical protein KCP74_10920 [Salmonella enterica subsp. enterica]
MANQHRSGSNEVSEKKVGYHRFIPVVRETAMFRIKPWLGGHLVSEPYGAQAGCADGDGQSAEPDDVAGNAVQRQACITSAPVGVLYPYRWPILNYSTKPHVVITYQMQIKQHKAF